MTATLHVLLAGVWVLLQGEVTARSVVMGTALAAAVVWLLRPVEGSEQALRRVWMAARLAGRFIAEMSRSAVTVTAAIWSPRGRVFPGIVEVPTRLRGDGEVTLLANLITMTPGTMTVEVPMEQDRLFVFALDARRPQRVRTDIRDAFERSIQEVTR